MTRAMGLFIKSAIGWFEVRRGIRRDMLPVEADKALSDAIRGVYPNNPVNAFAGLKGIPLAMYFQPEDSNGRCYLWIELRQPITTHSESWPLAGPMVCSYMRLTLDDPEDEYEWATTLATKLPDDAVLLFQDLQSFRSCPRDTNGDGDCGQPLCPFCGGRR